MTVTKEEQNVEKKQQETKRKFQNTNAKNSTKQNPQE